ncbi:MAG: SDR family NAD(P)-dependent oxidoreductase [Chloroflexota bacterium]
MLGDLTGKIAVITGAGSGIGLGTAKRLAEQGADLFLHYRTPRPQMEEAVAAIRAAGRRVETMSADFAPDPGRAAQVVEEALARLGRVDILVNNAAVVTKRQVLEDYPRELFEEHMAVNVTAVFLALQAAARHMIARGGGGRIINLSSVHARITSEDLSGYAAAKGAINALTYSAAVRLGPHGITVNAVAPGAIEVEHFALNKTIDRTVQLQKTPMRRLGRPDDIAALIAFLAGDESSYISGEVIYVDGAVTRRMSFI